MKSFYLWLQRKTIPDTILFFFQNGKLAKIPLSAYQTKTNRKKLANAYSTVSPVCAIWQETEASEYLLTASNQKTLLMNSAAVNPKSTRNSQGVSVMTLNKNCLLEKALPYQPGMIGNPHRFRTKNLPARGTAPKPEDLFEQIELKAPLENESDK